MMQQKMRMAGQNLGASLGVPSPSTGVAQGHHGHVDAMLGQPPHPVSSILSPAVAYAAQRGAFAQE
jgi:hypothetical protein